MRRWSFEEIQRREFVTAKVRAGIESAEKEGTVPASEVRKRLRDVGAVR
jgi:predicted transcriptional regulator